VDALWTQVQPASDSLASHILHLVACSPLDGVGVVVVVVYAIILLLLYKQEGPR
jgi:hypothetical protein